MKNKKLIIFAGILTTIICCYLGLLSSQRSELSVSSPVKTIDTMSCATLPDKRLSIAFILGEDKETDNPYYEEATRYYTISPDGKTDIVVRTCRSLLEVKNYLKTNLPSNGLAWGDVHLVSHGNQWTGLSVKVTPDSKRATTQRLTGHTQSAAFTVLDQTVIDSGTRIFLHGCGIGNNADLVEAVRSFFSFKNGLPAIIAPKLFEYYASSGSGDDLQSQRYLAESWLVCYPMDDKPTQASLTNALRDKYVDASVDWQGALSREQPRWIGDVYHYTFEVPVKWVIPVDSLPELGEQAQQITWLQSQTQIVDELKALQIPIEKFKWSTSGGYVDTESGARSQAIFVKGYCTMLCVLQALTDGHDERMMLQKPMLSSTTDTRFYYSSPETRLAGI